MISSDEKSTLTAESKTASTLKIRLRRLGKDSIVYGIGGTIAKGIGFFLLPVYTYIFAPAPFGQIDMLNTLTSLLSAVLGMGMDSAQSFYFFEQRSGGKSEQARVISAILQWRLSWGVGIVTLATLLSPILNTLFFGGALRWEHFAVAFVNALFTQVMSQSIEIFRLLYRPWFYISVSLTNTIMTALMTVTLALWLNMGVMGYFVGSLIGTIVAMATGWYIVRDYINWSHWHREWWPRLVRFGAPLVPAALAMYVLDTADRWFVNYYYGASALGLYSVGDRFALFITLAITTFRQAWWPVALDAMHSSDGPEVFRTISRLYLGVCTACVVLLTALSPVLVRLLAAPAYHDAYPIVGILVWPPVFYGFYLIASAGIWKAEQTKWSFITMLVASIVNILLNFVFVPPFGIIGAAISAALAFLVWAIVTLVISERLWLIQYPIRILFIQIAIAASVSSLILAAYGFGQPVWQGIVVAVPTALLLLSSGIKMKYWKRLIQATQVRLRRLFSFG